MSVSYYQKNLYNKKLKSQLLDKSLMNEIQ